MGKSRPRPGWAQAVIVGLFVAFVLGMAYVTQYVMKRAVEPPRAPGPQPASRPR